ncbi:uncharacterized protein LOC134252605 [Saccostrea cucullata]|uniref:uncharacterized protein LOC134252605 n=1 Tax=Saccostrea cuccullata TaxID=36930 RepID=UPI002ED28460
MINSVFSAYSIYTGRCKNLVNIPDAYHGLLFSILFSEDRCIFLEDDRWHTNLTKIRETFQLTEEKRTIAEDIVVINEIVDKKNILTKSGSTISFKTYDEDGPSDADDLVMIEFTMRSLRKLEDYESLLSLGTKALVYNYCVFWDNLFLGDYVYIPEELNEMLIFKLGFCAIEYFSTGEIDNDDDLNMHYLSIYDGQRDLVNRVSETSESVLKLCEDQFEENVQEITDHGRKLPYIDKNVDILLAILLADGYRIPLKHSWKENIHRIKDIFHVQVGDGHTCVHEANIHDIVLQNEMLKISENSICFRSENIRHYVMSFFVFHFLKTDDDYEKYINHSSVDSLFEYVRTWWYKRDEAERCMYLPNGMERQLILRLGFDALKHVMVEERYDSLGARNVVNRRFINAILNIPEEILHWDYDARCRYVEMTREGSYKTHRARAMLVGCAGAGKTTLLKRLRKQRLEELNQTRSTKGLDVHTDIFEIDENAKRLKGE